MTTAVPPPCDRGVVQGADIATPCRRVTERWVLAAAVLGSGMAFIDGTVVTLALPQLQVEMEASLADAQWVVESYALLLSALLLVGGSLGDRFGRRRVFAFGAALFAGASAACALASSIDALILARALQGVGGALLVPGSLAIIGASFPPSTRGRAIGIWSAWSGISAGLGPVLGGWLVEHFSWRWAFLVNVPIAAAALAITARHVPESRDEHAPRRLDWAGALLATAGLGGVVFGLIESETLGWTDPRIVGALAAGLVALMAFAIVERRSAHPMVAPRLFSSRTFTGANVLTLLLYAALGGVLFFLPLNLIQVQGYTPTAAGAALMPFIAIMFALSGWSGGLVDRIGGRGPLVAGPLIAAAGFGGLAIPGVGGAYWSTFFPAIVVMGFGMAIAVAPLTTVVIGAVDASQVGVASGVNNAVARMAGLLAIAALSIVVSTAFNSRLDDRLRDLEMPLAARDRFDEERPKLAAARIPAGLDAVTATRLQDGIHDAFAAAFRHVAIVAALAGGASALVAWFTIDGGLSSRR